MTCCASEDELRDELAEASEVLEREGCGGLGRLGGVGFGEGVTGREDVCDPAGDWSRGIGGSSLEKMEDGGVST